MNNALYQKLFTEAIKGGMLCPGRLANLTHYLLQASKLDGDIVEFGCNVGRTAALMACVCPDKTLWVYDSFQGLPKPTEEDSGKFGEGLMKVDAFDLASYFFLNDIPIPRVVSAWFKDIKMNELPKRIAFAHLDGDLYDSIKTSLEIVWPKMAFMGKVLIDDYGWEVTPGVKRAVDEFTEAHELLPAIPLSTGNTQGPHAILMKT